MTSFSFTIPYDTLTKKLDSLLLEKKTTSDISSILKIDEKKVLEWKMKIIFSHLGTTSLIELREKYDLSVEEIQFYNKIIKQLKECSKCIKERGTSSMKSEPEPF